MSSSSEVSYTNAAPGKSQQYFLLQLADVYASAASTTSMTPSCGIEYFSLSPEIRNMSMEIVLHPWDIYINPSGAAAVEPVPKYGIQLLVTCHQAYNEGSSLYYGGSTFHILPCSIEEIKGVLEAYQPKHLEIMNRVTVECGIHDLRPRRLLQFYRVTKSITIYKPEALAECLGDAVVEALRSEWKQKATWLLRVSCPRLHLYNCEVLDPLLHG